MKMEYQETAKKVCQGEWAAPCQPFQSVSFTLVYLMLVIKSYRKGKIVSLTVLPFKGSLLHFLCSVCSNVVNLSHRLCKANGLSFSILCMFYWREEPSAFWIETLTSMQYPQDPVLHAQFLPLLFSTKKCWVLSLSSTREYTKTGSRTHGV